MSRRPPAAGALWIATRSSSLSGVVAACLALACLETAALQSTAAPVHAQSTRVSMGCSYTINAYGSETAALTAALDAALDEVDRIDRLMSHYRDDSLLSRVNREAGKQAVAVSPELFEVITTAFRFAAATDGAFDITVGPLMRAWGFFRDEGRMPSSQSLAAALGTVGMAHVRLDAEALSIRFLMDGVELDLGAIAKGYAVDRAMAVLRGHGITTALVDGCGSSLAALGSPPGRHGWPVQIQDPLDVRKIALTVALSDRALAISGTSERFFESGGVRYSHILDPRSGTPVQGLLSAIVESDSATSADALGTAFFVLGPEASRRCIGRFPGTSAAFLLPDGDRGWRSVQIGSGMSLSAPSD